MNLVGNTKDLHGWRDTGFAGPAACMGHGQRKKASPDYADAAFTEFIDDTAKAGDLWLYRTVELVAKEAKRIS